MYILFGSLLNAPSTKYAEYVKALRGLGDNRFHVIVLQFLNYSEAPDQALYVMLQVPIDGRRSLNEEILWNLLGANPHFFALFSVEFHPVTVTLWMVKLLFLTSPSDNGDTLSTSSKLRGSVPKNGPIDFASKNHFSLTLPMERVWYANIKTGFLF